MSIFGHFFVKYLWPHWAKNLISPRKPQPFQYDFRGNSQNGQWELIFSGQLNFLGICIYKNPDGVRIFEEKKIQGCCVSNAASQSVSMFFIWSHATPWSVWELETSVKSQIWELPSSSLESWWNSVSVGRWCFFKKFLTLFWLEPLLMFSKIFRNVSQYHFWCEFNRRIRRIPLVSQLMLDSA